MNPQMAIAITGKNMTKPAFDAVANDANRVATAVSTSGGRMGAAMGDASFQTANLAAQFNDIGVMLASGQSPMLLALQQGTQISQVLGPMGAAGAVNALKTAFISLFNPVSLITIGTIAAGAALFQYFTSLNTDGKASTEVLKEQNDVLRRVAQNWGEAVPALTAYVDQLDRAAEVGDLGEATKIAQKQIFAEFVPQVEELGMAFDIVRETTAASVDESQRLDRAYDSLVDRMKDGSASAGDLKTLLDLLSASQVGNTETGQMLIGILNQMAGAFNKAAAGAASLGAQTSAALGGPDMGDSYRDRQAAQYQFMQDQERVNGLTAEQLALELEVARVKSDAKGDDIVLTEGQALTLAQQRLDAEERRQKLAADGKAGGKAISNLERERQAVTDLIAELEYEQSLIGLTNEEKEIQNALRRAGAEATDEERQRIAELITTTQEHEAAQKLMTDRWSEYGKIGQNAIRGVKDALKDGKIEANEMADILAKIGDSFLDMALNGVFSMFGGGGAGKKGGGGFLGGLFGFSEGGGGTVGGTGGYTPGGADDTLFVAKAQSGEPFAFGDTAINGLGGGGRGGASVVFVQLDPGLRGKIISQAVGQSVKIAEGMVKPVSEVVSQMAQQLRFG